jgi:TPP-dependent pyruvate/acetoin dehydrogenase alpha subunit
MTTTTPPTETATAADRDTRLRLYRTMVECRQFETRAQELFFEGLVRGTTHLGIGQEAVAAGFAAAMRSDDYTFCTYRGHNHTLARGVPMAPILAELFGRATGLLGGKGGSMHLTSVEHGVMGSYAIVGAHMPIALGAAWSAQYRKSGQVAVCFFGDGTTNIGAFHEALNMAAVWKAPVVFVCENNLYMEYTPIGAVTAVERPAADRASAYGLEPIVVDGNDADAVYAVAVRAIERARSGDGPSLVEAVTYRHGGHSRADPGKYRPDDEVASWKARDPIPALRAKLVESGVDTATLDKIDEETQAAVAAAEAEARAAPEPSLEVIETQVWADGGSSWRSRPRSAAVDTTPQAPIEAG